MRCSVASHHSASDPSRLEDAESAGFEARPDLWRDMRQKKKRTLHLQLNSLLSSCHFMASSIPPRQAEGSSRELLVLTGERRVLVLQVEALRAEAQRAETDLQCQHRRHQAELQQLREESLQVRRAVNSPMIKKPSV